MTDLPALPLLQPHRRIGVVERSIPSNCDQARPSDDHGHHLLVVLAAENCFVVRDP